MIFLHWFGVLLFDICLYSALFDFAFCYCEPDFPRLFPSSNCWHIDKLWSFLSSHFTQLVLLLFLVVFQMLSCVSWVESLTWQDDDLFFLIVNDSNSEYSEFPAQYEMYGQQVSLCDSSFDGDRLSFFVR